MQHLSAKLLFLNNFALICCKFLANLCKSSEILKQYDAKWWLNYRKYESVSYSFSCKENFLHNYNHTSRCIIQHHVVILFVELPIVVVPTWKKPKKHTLINHRINFAPSVFINCQEKSEDLIWKTVFLLNFLCSSQIEYSKGGLISENFSLWLKSPKKGAKSLS